MTASTFYTKLPSASESMTPKGEATVIKAVRSCLATLLVLVCGVPSASLPATEPQLAEEPPVKAGIDAVGYEQSFPALGTMVTFKAFHAERQVVETAFELAQLRVEEIAAILTDYDPKSETRRLSLTASKSRTKTSDDLWAVLKASDEWHRRAGGAFDSSLGQLTSLWRKYRRVNAVPPGDQIQAALRKCGWRHVELHDEQHAVTIDTDGLRFDFGAIGKGYIVDEAFGVLRENGLSCCLVNISGNMRCGAPPPAREGWRIEVSPLEAGGGPLRRIQLANAAVATSGDLWQFMMIDGQRRSHILDPKTGLGVLGPVSATVVAATATDADALATAACILEWSETQILLEMLANESPALRPELLVARKNARGELRMKTTAGFPGELDSPNAK